jgi:nicotinamidase-related amidase
VVQALEASVNVLVVVDMQQAGIGPTLHDVDAVVRRINRLASRLRRSGGAVVFVQHDGAPGDPFEPFTPGWEIADSIETNAADRRVRKTLNDSFYGTALDATLSDLGAETVTIAGWATDFCVDATVRSAVSRGLHVTVASDCHTLADRPHLGAEAIIEHHNWVWANLLAPGSVRVTAEHEILWGRAR